MSTQSDTFTEVNEEVSHCKMYRVILHNDSVTTIDFVILILMRFFEKKLPDALKLTVEIHKQGSGVAGIYPFEGAEFRVEQVVSLARSRGFPLSCNIEPV